MNYSHIGVGCFGFYRMGAGFSATVWTGKIQKHQYKIIIKNINTKESSRTSIQKNYKMTFANSHVIIRYELL